MSLFPMFLKLTERKALVVGAGAIAEAKIESLLQAEADVLVVAPEASHKIQRWASAGKITWHKKSFQLSDLEGIFLVIAATPFSEVNATVFENARLRRILCNAVDDPEHCDFYYPAVVRRGKLQLAISTEGNSPALAQKLRKQLEAQYGPEYEGWLDELGEARRNLFITEKDPKERRKKLHELASTEPARAGDREASHAW